MKILVDGEVKFLSIIDKKSGCDWILDLLGNNNALIMDDEENYIMSSDDFEWWECYIKGVEEYQTLANDMIESGFNSDLVNDAIMEAISYIDLEDQPKSALKALKELKEKGI